MIEYMDRFFLYSGILLFITMLVVLYRVIFGPGVMNRIMAVNMIGTKTSVLLIIIGTLFNRVDMFVDFALTYALLNFTGSLAAANFFERHTLPPSRLPETKPAEETP